MSKAKKSMKIPHKLTYLILLAIIPFIFYLGILYEQGRQTLNINSQTETTSSGEAPNDWKTYTNTKYGFSVKYPPTGVWGKGQKDGSLKDIKTAEVIVRSDQNISLEKADSVLFELDAPIAGVPMFYVSIMDDLEGSHRERLVYESLSQPHIDKFFGMNIGEELDRTISKEIGCGILSTNPGVYKRLPDVEVNGNQFLMVECPRAYGQGTERRLLLKMNGKVFMIGKTYYTEEGLKEFEQFYSSFKFIN